MASLHIGQVAHVKTPHMTSDKIAQMLDEPQDASFYNLHSTRSLKLNFGGGVHVNPCGR